jgi:transcriptional regulator with XRE-family HTH domain
MGMIYGVIVDKGEFGLRIKELRKAAGLSQAALAKAAGVSQSRLSDWELGRFAPSITDAPELATALGVTVADLFKPATAPPKHPAATRGPGRRKPRPGRKPRGGKSEK